MMIRSFVCDWEGCGSYPGGGKHPWPTMDLADLTVMINKMYIAWLEDRRNPQLVLCTGRQFPYGEAVLQSLNAFWDESLPSILENGAGLYIPKTKKVIWNSRITPATSSAMFDVRAKSASLVERVKGEREVGKEFCISLNPPESIYSMNEIANQEYGLAVFDESGKKKEPIKLFYEIVMKELDYFVKNGIIEITHSKSAVDITPCGVNKGTGIEEFCIFTGIQMDQVVGVGDSKGDMPLLQRVGYPACPANADSFVKEVCGKNPNGYISKYECAAGIVDIVRHYLPNLD
jgi:HAD superfamily hydrolase (TIGR01484 family)